MKLSDLIFDDKNANLGTEKGTKLLETSLSKYGAGRSILIDKNNSIISGNKTIEMAGQLGFDNIKVVETSGDTIVAVKRMDLDLKKDKKARELAYADNRVSEVDLSWDIKQLQFDLPELEMSEFFSELDFDFTGGNETSGGSGSSSQEEADSLQEEEDKGFNDLNDWCFFHSSNKWGIPDMLPNKGIEIPEVLLEYREEPSKEDKGKKIGIHYFMQDYRIRSTFTRLKEITESRIKKIGITLTPDFSPYSNYPPCLQVFNVYRNRFCGRYWQNEGIPVIPTVTWNNDPACYDYVFCGIPKGSVISFSIVGGHSNMEEEKKEDKRGIEEMMNRLEPSKVLIYGESWRKWEERLKIIPENLQVRFNSRWIKRKEKYNAKTDKQGT